MADSRRFAITPQLDIEQILLEAQQRWLRPAEICEILRNYPNFRIAPEPPNKPPSGSLFLFDRKVLRYFRKDGHNWRKKKDGKTVKEAHERLKAGSVDVLHCYYAHGEDNENFQRRSYWMLEEDFMHIVLVHYREVKNSKAYIRNREAEENRQGARSDSPGASSSITNQSQLPLQIMDSGSPISAQTSEYVDNESDNYQTNSRYNSLPEMQQYGDGSVTNTGHLNTYPPYPCQNNQYDCGSLHSGSSASGFYSLSHDDVAGTSDCHSAHSGSKNQFGLASWEQVLQQYSTELHCLEYDSAGASVQNANLGNSGQASVPVGEFFINEFPFNQDQTQEKSVWQLGKPEISSSFASNLNEDGELSIEGNRAYAALLKQLSLDPSNGEGEGLKKYDSFTRWMSKEFGEGDDLNLKSTSGLNWSAIEGESVGDDSAISNQEQLDLYLVSPSIAQEQLFSIVDFSPNWAYTGLETKVLITGTFLKKGDKEKYKWSCMFGEVEVPADILADGTLCCHTPPHKPGRVPFYITCSNRLACSEVREFEYRDVRTQYMETEDSWIRMVNEKDLRVRLEKLLYLDPVDQPKPASRILNDKQNLINEINLLMVEVEDEWFNPIEPVHGLEFLKLLKEKLHQWLLDRVLDDGKGPNILDKDGQGVIHLAAALGYDWAIKPTVIAGVSVNFRDLRGWTALHWAAFCGRERTVATLIGLGAAPGALTDPTKLSSGRTPADLASSNGHKGIAGFLAESSLTSHLFALTLKDSKHSSGALAEVSGMTNIEGISSRTGDNMQGVPLKDSLGAVRIAAQAAARIHQVFRVESFQRKKLIEYTEDDMHGKISDEQALSLVSLKAAKSGQRHDLPMHAAAVRIQNKFRGWKGRKEFLVIRQRIVKIQAHVRGHQVRKHYKSFVWTVGIVEKAILRWRRKGSGLRGFRSDGLIEGPSMQSQPLKEKEDDYDFLKDGRRQTEVRLEKALARVKSMVQYPEARDQYTRLLNVITKLQEPKEGVMIDVEETGEGDLVTELEELWDDGSFMLDT